MERIPVIMVLRPLERIPNFPVQPGYRIRRYQIGEEKLWADVESAAGEFPSPDSALDRFRKEFGGALREMEERCFFLETASGRVIGTASAWYDHAFRGESWGRLHWVAIHPEFQGKGLAKPLVGAAMEQLARAHDKAYLTTQTTSWIAVRVYLAFGFEPLADTPRAEEAWRMLAELTGHPSLRRFLGA